MNKLIRQLNEKHIAAITFAALVLCVSLNYIDIVKAQVFRYNERDVLASDITTPICDPTLDQYSTDVAMNENRGYAFVWEDSVCDGSGTGIFIEHYDMFNGPNPAIGGPVQVNSTAAGDQKNPAIAMDHEGNYVVVWQGNGPGDADGIFMRAFKSDGTPVAAEARVNTTTSGIQSNPKVAMDFDTNVSLFEIGEFVVVWQGEGAGDTEGIYMQRYSVDFNSAITPFGPNMLVNSYTTGAQVDPDVAMNNFREIIVTWSGPGTGFPSTNEIWMQGYDWTNMVWVGSATNARVNSTSPATKPAIASDKSTEPGSNTVAGGKSVIVYEAGADINGKLVGRCNVGGCPLGNVELNIDGSGNLPDVAMDYLGNFTASWEQDDTPEGQYMNIHAINYDYSGRRIDNQFRVNENSFSDGSKNQTDSAVAKDKDGEYFVTWTTPSFEDDLDIRYRGYRSDIFKRGSENLAHDASPLATEFGTSTAIAPNGNYVIAYLGEDPVSFQTRVFYTLYGADNTIIAESQIADTVDDSSVGSPSVSFFKDTAGTGLGRFVISWYGTDPATSSQEILYREFDINGVPATPTELVVNQPNPFATYLYQNISAGYYNDDTSTVIDRFAVIYVLTSTLPAGGAVVSAYHTNLGFIYNDLVSLNPSCEFYCANVNLDIYPDINGNDRMVYVWEAEDANQSGIFAHEANGGTLSGSAFLVNDITFRAQAQGDIAFVSPTQYVITWAHCPDSDCAEAEILASRYTGDFAGGVPTVTDADFVVYPANALDINVNHIAKVAGDPDSGSFLIVWEKTYNDVGVREISGKYFESAAGLSNFGIGFTINASAGVFAGVPSVDMNRNGRTIVGWEGGYNPFGLNLDGFGSVFQLLNNPSFVETVPELPTAAQLTITEGGKTLTIPSTIQFPAVTASTTMNIDAEREIDENPAPGQPLFFQLEDLGGNSTGCVPGPCYSVTISSSDFTYTDPATSTVYTIPATNIFIKNYDGNHPGVVNTGTCGSPEANLSFETVFGIGADFELDGTTCDYVSIDSNRTLINKISNTSDTARIRLYPELKMTIPSLTPPGTYTGTITITSA